MAAEDEVMEDVEEAYIPEGGIQIGDIYIPPPPLPACTFDSNGPRLMITHIENHFYKSYAGKQVLGPFHKSFSSIVGPNGSGKSNVIDSMLFVFGYGGSKQRSKKLSNLIHNSESYPNVQQCTVAVHFQQIIDKGEDFEVVPNSKFVVARTAFKDNSSFYTIDGKRQQRKEVCKLLRDRGIDLDHNRFLILQGEVENISLMKPKALTEHDTGMLEFLEDIIGTSRFKVPIEMLAAKVAELNEQRVEKLNRVKLVEKEKDDLEGPMKEALEFIRMENQVVEKNHKLRQRYILDADRNIVKANAKKEEIEASVSDMTEKMKEVVANKKGKEDEMKETGTNFEKLEKEIEELNDRFKKIEIEDATIREELKNTNVKRKKIKQQAELEKGKKDKLANLPEENRKKIEECEELKDKLEKKVVEEEANYETAMSSLKADTQVFQDEKAIHETKLVDLKKTVNEAAAELNLASTEHEVYVSAEKKEQIRLDDIKNRIKTTHDSVKDKSARLAELTELVPAKEKELVGAQNEMSRVTDSHEQARQRLRVMRSEYDEKRLSQAATKSQGAVVDALMAQKKNGNIPGIIGRLGDLGSIDLKYDVAISTAVGGNLDKVLVDSTATGKQCIEFLKKNNIGRGNFLALDKTKGKWDRQMQPIDTPQNVPRLFDLITIPDQNHASAFYQSMRDTLVAKDMDQASQVAYGAKRYRTVTLGGEMIETSGTMSGGGKTVFKGKMGQQVKAVETVSPRELQNMEKGITEVQSEVENMGRRKGELENQIYRLTGEIKDLKKQMGKLGVEVNPLKEQAGMLERQVADQEKRVKEAAPDKKRVAEMKKRIDAAQNVYDDADSAAKVVEKDVKSCDAKIKEITGGKIKNVQKKLDDTRKQLDKIKGEVTKLNVEIKSTDRNLKKCEDKLENFEAEVKECEEKMLGIQERRKEIETEGGAVMDQTTEKKEQSKELRESIAKLKKVIDEISKEENELKSSRIEVDQKLAEWDEAVKDNTKKVTYWKREMKKMSLQEVPGEDQQELVELSEEQVEEINIEELNVEIAGINDKIQASKPNMAAIAEYKKKENVYMERVAELDKMTAARDEQRKHHDDIRKQRLNDFMEGFSIITGKLKEMYQMITLGGDAELELVDSLDPFAEGIVFSVRPPKKSWKNISNLSGGEKTLSSLALVFALHYYKPTPLYVMDEIDAALDFKNVSIVANYIKERTKNAQFIIISLRSNMFELADRLVGIYKTYNCTKTVTINPGMVEIAHSQPNINLQAPTPSKVAPTPSKVSQHASRPLADAASINGARTEEMIIYSETSEEMDVA